MSHSFVRILIHAVWSTKNREHLIQSNIENQIHNLLIKKFEEKGCHILALNGIADHIHVLFQFNYKLPLDEILKSVKGGSSYEINQSNIASNQFAWQTGFGAFSVSDQNKDQVIKYIQHQKVRHKSQSFEEEMKWMQNHLN